ncbi:hypothetical protein [Vreelandella titanicae]|uniref:hypothetical protein n=1 Tax=Vreelandella titanicae TaxID=664683 RepID=UPI0039BEE658
MENNKIEPEHDSCRTNLLIFFMGMIWNISKQIATLEVATLAAWFYLFESHKYSYALLALSVSLFFLVYFYFAQKRYLYLSRKANLSLQEKGDIYLGNDLKKSSFERIGGNTIAKHLSIAVILLNIAIFIVTATIWLQ